MRLITEHLIGLATDAVQDIWDIDTPEEVIAEHMLRATVPLVVETLAQVAERACLVPPDGGAPTPEERAVADRAAADIRALTKEPPEGAS